MELLKDPLVQEYKSSLGGNSTYRHVMTKCRCIYLSRLPKKIHRGERASDSYENKPYDRISDYIKFNVLIISKEIYYPAETMKSLLNDMLNCKQIKKIEKFYCIIDLNFKLHPPCAKYMKSEYTKLFLSPSDETVFDEMPLWTYLLKLFERLIEGTSPYGDNEMYDLAFQRFFDFCVQVLQMDYDFSKKIGSTPLIMECLNRKKRVREITKYLDKLYNSGYNFATTVIKFALLIEQMKSDRLTNNDIGTFGNWS